MPVLPVTALRFSKACNVGTFHAFARSNIGYYYGKPLLKRYVRKLHARIAVSNPAREFVRHYFPGDYRVIPNGIDLSRFQNQPPYPELRDGMCNLLFVGRLEYRKGLGYLLRACPAQASVSEAALDHRRRRTAAPLVQQLRRAQAAG